jgi:hypothetical protein
LCLLNAEWRNSQRANKSAAFFQPISPPELALSGT